MKFLLSALCAAVFFLPALPARLAAQVTISGKITDAKSGESLPAANIHIEGTYRGTISNGEGGFELVIPSLPATVIVRYIGYETYLLQVRDAAQTTYQVRLKPVDLALPEIVVTGEDPAKDIMRKVIANKKIWRAKLNTFQAEAYTRQSLQTDTMIASITESFSTAYWDRKQGPKEIIKAKRQTRNVSAASNFAGASYIPNFYDDDIEIANFRMVGPTHPDALDFYTFKLADYQYIDNKLIFILDMKPRRPLQPTFVGTLKVLAEGYALIEVDVKPGESVTFPPPIQEFNVFYRQQFNNFGGDFWLPVDVRMNGLIKVGLPGLQFPPIRYQQISTLTDYQVNVLLPDSLYKKKSQILFDSLSIAQSSQFVETREPVPMSLQEQKAYEKLDSTQTFEKMFKPKGVLARFVEDDDEEDSGRRRRRRSENQKNKKETPPTKFEKFVDDLTPDAWYNRVEGGHLAVIYEPTMPKKALLRPEFTIGYNTNLERYDGAADVRYTRKFGKKRVQFNAGFRTGADLRYQSTNYSRYTNSIASFFAFADYFDYFWNEQAWVSASGRFRKQDLDWTVRYSSQRHSSLSDVSSWNPIGFRDSVWANPAIDAGTMRPLELTVRWGGDFVPLAIVGQRNLELKLEHNSPLTGSDFTFTQAKLRADYRIETFYRRRFNPNALDVRFEASTYAGTLPLQRRAVLDGSIALLSPFGSFRTAYHNPLVARQTAALYWEHNFRTVPTEFVGLKGLAKKGYGLIVFGNHGYLAGPDQRYLKRNTSLPGDVWIHEAGIGINGLFSFARTDFTWRLDRPGFFVTITAARLF